MASRRHDPKSGRFCVEHGGKRTKLYRVWCSMKERCNNPNNKAFPRYGGRGISVCSEWSDDFAAFSAWANAAGYADGLTIDRVDNDGDYGPENCRWCSHAEQNRNYSRNRLLTVHGETKCLTDWADTLGINRATLLFRIKSGIPLEEALTNTDRRTKAWKTREKAFLRNSLASM